METTQAANNRVWTKPPMGALKLNVKGLTVPAWLSLQINMDHMNGIGGIMRDENGSLLKVFAGTVEDNDHLLVSLSAVLKGIQVAVQLKSSMKEGVLRLLIESSDEEAVMALNGTNQYVQPKGRELVDKIKSLSKEAQEINISLCSMEANAPAVFLADWGLNESKEVGVMIVDNKDLEDDTFEGLAELLAKDINGANI